MSFFQSMWDNNSGVLSGITQPISYFTLFHDLRGVYDRKIDTNLIMKESASAL